MARHEGYTVDFKPSAAKALRKLARDDQARVAARITALAHNPLPDDVKPLKEQQNLYRIRVGDIRIVYTVVRRRLTVLVLAVAKREDIYRQVRRLRP